MDVHKMQNVINISFDISYKGILSINVASIFRLPQQCKGAMNTPILKMNFINNSQDQYMQIKLCFDYVALGFMLPKVLNSNAFLKFYVNNFI